MKPSRIAAVTAACFLGATLSHAGDVIPLDFDRSLVSQNAGSNGAPEGASNGRPTAASNGSSNGSHADNGAAPLIMATYRNRIGIVVNPYVETRDRDVRLASNGVNGSIGALFDGKSGAELIPIAEAAARANPNQAVSILAAAVRRNADTGGTRENDLLIAQAILGAINGSLSADQVARIIALSTDRKSEEQIVLAVRELRNLHLNSLPENERFEKARELDSLLVKYNVATAMTLDDQMLAELQNLDALDAPGLDTNPFWTGSQGVTNFGASFGGASGGSGRGNAGRPPRPVTPPPVIPPVPPGPPPPPT